MNVRTNIAADKRKRDGFAIVPWAVIDARLGPHALAVYLVLARHADRDGNARPSMQRIADLAGVSRPTARNAVRVLESAGLIVITSAKDDNGVHLAHRYHLVGNGNDATPSGNGVADGGQPRLPPLATALPRGGQPRCQEPEPVEPEPEPEPKNQRQAPALAPRPAKPTAETIPIPSTLDTAEFRAAWESYLGHRGELGKQYTSQAATLQLESLAALGPERATAAVTHSTRNGYTGIFEPSRASEESRFAPIMPVFADAE